MKRTLSSQTLRGIQIFMNSEFGSVRTLIDTQGTPQFCLKDVCAALELDSRQVARRLDKGVVSKHSLKTEGGRQLATFVNEDGLYDVILDSRKPSARAFRKIGAPKPFLVPFFMILNLCAQDFLRFIPSVSVFFFIFTPSKRINKHYNDEVPM